MRPPLAFAAFFALVIALAPLAAAEPLYHVLAKGETIYSVARDYKVSPESILKANAISDPTRLKAGQRLVIPRGYLVQKGDTLYSIAKSNSISVDALRAANGLGPKSLILPGQLLVLPPEAKIVTDPARSPSSPEAAAAKPASSQAPSSPATASPGTAKPAANQPPSSAVTTKPGPSAAVAGKSPAKPLPVKTSEKAVDKKLSLPCSGEARYLDGKIDGIMILTERGVGAKAVSGGRVVSAGPYRGFGQVVFVQSKNGYIYVYGGNDSIAVRVGETVSVGQELGKIGYDAKEGGAAAYFFVFKEGQSLDPASAPRG